jgi:hypothetical protein
MLGRFTGSAQAASVRDAAQAALTVAPFAVLATVVAQVALGGPAASSVGEAIAAGIKWSLAAWALATAIRVALELASPQAEDLSHSVPSILGPRATPVSVLAIGATLIAAALLRAPARLVVNLAGFALVALPLVWLVRRRAGPGAATSAAAVLAVLAFFPTHLDVPADPDVSKQAADSRYSWSVAFPGAEWRLRQEIDLPAAPPGTWYTLGVAHAGGVKAPQVLARINDVEAGPLREQADTYLVLDLPPSLTEGAGRLVVELRSPAPDPGLRILAQRWTGGATRRGEASSYFDGSAWFPGTFNDATGRPQHGIYVIDLGTP